MVVLLPVHKVALVAVAVPPTEAGLTTMAPDALEVAAGVQVPLTTQ